MKALLLVLILLSNSYGGSVVRIRNWGIYNTVSDSHVHAVDAWTVTEGSRNIVVAVVDTGLDATHPDLAANVWHDPKTGYYGWDFVTNKPNPLDVHGHGTHVAGIIGARANSESGTSGVAHRVSLMAVRYYSEFLTGPQNMLNSVKALNWAIDHGARIINYSGGGPEFSAGEYEAIVRAGKLGILIVTAAGNEHSDIEYSAHAYYPCSYRFSNVICVTATNLSNEILPSSNYGSRKVDIAAPGENILSTFPGGRFAYMSGTSQATAFVTGAAVLVLSRHPDMSPKDVINVMKAFSDKEASLFGKVSSGGKLNAYSAVLR